MDQERLEEQIAAVAVLADPTRRRLYFLVASRADGIGREEAAEAAGISRALAAFHLDRLVEVGLLVTEYRRLSGRSGPGAGRPAKLYRRSDRQLGFSFPQKNYELLARLLAQALVADTGTSPRGAVSGAAHELGESLGTQARAQAGPRPGRERLLAEAEKVLDDCGYEATRDGPALCLRNCPFSPLSREYTDVVCSMNLALMEGMVSGLRIRGFEAALDPQDGCCCVRFRPAPRRSTDPDPAAPAAGPDPSEPEAGEADG